MIRGQKFKLIIYHDVYWNICFFGPGVQKWHFLFDLSAATNDLWPLIRGQKFKSIILPWCILKCRFFESRNSSMTSFFWSDLYEATNDLWSEDKNWIPYIYHDVYWNIGLLGQGIQKWHRFVSIWTIRDHQITSDLWSEVKNSNFIFLLWCILKYRFFGSRNSNMTSFYWYDLFEATQGPLTSDQWSKIQIHTFAMMHIEM